jgi:hypothetical protein
MAAVDVLSQQMAAKATLEYICEPRLGALIGMPSLEGCQPWPVRCWRAAYGDARQPCVPSVQSIGPWVAWRARWWS